MIRKSKTARSGGSSLKQKFSENQKKRLDEKEQGYIIGYIIKRENEERNKKRILQKIS